jgi:hypothetical protein
MSLGVGLQLQADWVAEQDEGQITHFYTRGTRVAIRTGSSTLNYLLGDHLGSQAITTNSSGGSTGEIRYYAWGTERYTSGTTPTTYHFTGQRLESALGLYFYNARWQDAHWPKNFVDQYQNTPATGLPWMEVDLSCSTVGG